METIEGRAGAGAGGGGRRSGGCEGVGTLNISASAVNKKLHTSLPFTKINALKIDCACGR